MSATRGRLEILEAGIRRMVEARGEEMWREQRNRIKMNELNPFEEAMLEGFDKEVQPLALAFCENGQTMARNWCFDLPKPEEIRQRRPVVAELERRHGRGFHLEASREW